jgi:hypothetical protein
MIFCATNLLGQKLTGVWEGTLNQGLRVFTFKISVQHFHNSVRGFSYIYDSEGNWGKISFKGSFRNDTLIYAEGAIKKQNPGPNSWCIKSGKLNFGRDTLGVFISGAWQGGCSPGTLLVRKISSVDSLSLEEQGELVLDGDQIICVPKRSLKPGKSVKIKKKTLKAFVFDSREEDGDSITIVFNDQIILKNYGLKKQPKKIILRVDASLPENKLVLYAENLGKTPPNTATIKIKSGYGKKSITLQSDFTSNDNISFVLSRSKAIIRIEK